MEKTEAYLKRYGVNYMFPNVTPTAYYVIRVMMGLLVGLVGIKINIMCVPVLAVLGSFIPKILIYISNNSDNDAMLSDISGIYDIMKIQARAGVFIQDSLTDCYLTVKNPRLKSALLELCNGISAQSSLEDEVENFRMKFSNRHIDVLCIILSQAQTTGKTVQILDDMSEQIQQVRHTLAVKGEGKLERKIEILELMIFIGILGIGVYSMGNEIMQMLVF
ncbi:MAG: type II secretion system F family protein [Lachnospiraceae bacterium]|nr:type II secretion system F family protein [Lachnospiraceae bacterium]